MTKNTINLIGILITVVVGSYFYVNLCSGCINVEEEAVPMATSYPFEFKDGNLEISVNDNFNFNVSSANIVTPISQEIREGVLRLKNHLTTNPNKKIGITAYHRGDEDNPTAFPDLGLARANAVKNYFVSQGISSTKINSTGKQRADLIPDGDIYHGPLRYRLEERIINAESVLAALFDKIKEDDLVLQFDTDETSITLTDEQRQKFANISKYLDLVEGATVLVVGHTDGIGEDSTNMAIGQNRANFAKLYLMANGITENRINAISKGSKDPFASNATAAGRAKNRRAIITIN